MNNLPVPKEPYRSWSEFVAALWLHGSHVSNMVQGLANAHIDSAAEAIKRSVTERSEARTVRPSSFLACGRQPYFMLQDEHTPEKMPGNIGNTFAVGHLLHELSYAAVQSACPHGFHIETEKSVSLPDWWPKDHKMFNTTGHVDMLITIPNIARRQIADSAASKYLDTDIIQTQPKMLVDFKTMGGYTYRKHGKTIFGTDPDAFGYLAQLAVYADSLGVTEYGALLAGINRDSLTKPLFPRYITPTLLRDEADRVKVAIDMALDGSDPGEEFLIRHGSDGHFQCGRGGKPGFCAFRTACRDNPTGQYE